jgi:hypothetical protein
MEYSTYTTKVKGPGVDHTIWLRWWSGKTDNLDVLHEDFPCSEFDEVKSDWFHDESGGKYGSHAACYPMRHGAQRTAQVRERHRSVLWPLPENPNQAAPVHSSVGRALQFLGGSNK